MSIWSKFSHAPAWRLVASWFALFYAVQRGAAAYAAHATELGTAWVGSLGLQALSGVLVFVALRFRIRWIVPSVVLAGVLVMVTSVLAWGAGFMGGPAALVRLAVAAAVTAGCALVLRAGLRADANVAGR